MPDKKDVFMFDEHEIYFRNKIENEAEQSLTW